MYNIGILGSGRVATVLASKLSSIGHTITIGTRDIAKATVAWKGAAVTFKDQAQTARDASIIINATPGDTSLERLSTLKTELDGKILIDLSNATERGENGMPGNLKYPNSSLAEHLQAALPNTSVVKTLNTMLFTVMVDPASLNIPATAFLSGNDQDAKAVVSGLLSDLGWTRDQIEDLGDISSARGVEAVMLLVPHIIRSRGFLPFAFTLAVSGSAAKTT
jgi:8-hydroxy-5-deazaflavin:NADPH oxidoreductase